MWTRGYDVYTPNKIAVAHDYYDKMPGVASNDKSATHGFAIYMALTY
jgi:hypothetical protein